MSPRDQLTTKEIQVSTRVWQGLTNPEIAKATAGPIGLQNLKSDRRHKPFRPKPRLGRLLLGGATW